MGILLSQCDTFGCSCDAAVLDGLITISMGKWAVLVRETFVIHSRLSWRQVRGAAVVERQHGLQALAIEHLAARLAGGFLQTINSDTLKEAIGEVIAMDTDVGVAVQTFVAAGAAPFEHAA